VAVSAATEAPSLRDIATLHTRLLRGEVAGTRNEVAGALHRLRRAIDDGRPIDGLRAAMLDAVAKLSEAHDILQRVEAEHFRGERE
jgi:hypothetical protein